MTDAELRSCKFPGDVADAAGRKALEWAARQCENYGSQFDCDIPQPGDKEYKATCKQLAAAIREGVKETP